MRWKGLDCVPYPPAHDLSNPLRRLPAASPKGVKLWGPVSGEECGSSGMSLGQGGDWSQIRSNTLPLDGGNGLASRVGVGCVWSGRWGAGIDSEWRLSVS